jgi:hypothetical protein
MVSAGKSNWTICSFVVKTSTRGTESLGGAACTGQMVKTVREEIKKYSGFIAWDLAPGLRVAKEEI